MIPPNTASMSIHPVENVPNTNVKMPEIPAKTDRLGREVIELLKGAITEARRAKGKDIVAMIGNTGTGKSTAVNQFLNRKMCFVRHQVTGKGTIQVAEGEEEVAKIGHRAGTSETRYAHIYEKEGFPLIFADCGGFFDTRGITTDIAVVSSVKLTLENAKSVRLVLCFDSSVITCDRAIHFSQSVNLALGTLLRDYQKHPESVLLMFTKPTRDLDGTMFNAETAKRILIEIRDDLMEGPQKKLYSFLLRENGRYIAVCDPLSDESKRTNIASLLQMGKIENTKEAFQTAYSAHSQLKLMEEMTAIAVTGSGLYSQYFSNQETINRYTDEIASLRTKILNIQESIRLIGNGNQDPAVIQAAEKAIIVENRNLIRQQEERANELHALIKESNLKIESINEKIALVDKRGEDEVEYWCDQINQEGINIESKTVTTTTHEKSGLFSSSSSTETSTTSTYDKRAIPRDFIYRGPEILRVVKDPEDASRWSKECKTTDSYSIHYESLKGEPAVASVKVFIKRKHLPAEISEKAGHEKEIAREKTTISQLLVDIGAIQNIIHQAELGIAAKGSTLEKIAIFTSAAKELEASLAEYDQKLNEKTKESADLKDHIQKNQDDIDFLKNYLELSNDTHLKNKEIIAKLLKQNQDYMRFV